MLAFITINCGERMKKHMKKQICNVLDLPVLDKETRYDVETIQFRCPQCGKFHTPRPALFSVRRSEFLSVPAEIKELICGNRYLLLKSPEKLSVPAQEKIGAVAQIERDAQQNLFAQRTISRDFQN